MNQFDKHSANLLLIVVIFVTTWVFDKVYELVVYHRRKKMLSEHNFTYDKHEGVFKVMFEGQLYEITEEDIRSRAKFWYKIYPLLKQKKIRALEDKHRREKAEFGVYCPSPESWQSCKDMLVELGESVKNLDSWSSLHHYITFEFGSWNCVTMLEYEKKITLQEMKELLLEQKSERDGIKQK